MVKFRCVVNQCCRYLAKTNKAHYEVSQANSQYLARVTHMMLTWCVTAALKESFQTFPDLLIRRYSWDDHRNSCKSTCCSCRMPFHMHSLMSETDYCDVNFSSRSYRYLCLRARSSVQMDISCRSWFFLAMCLPQ